MLYSCLYFCCIFSLSLTIDHARTLFWKIGPLVPVPENQYAAKKEERRLRSEGSSKLSGLTQISAAQPAARGLLLSHQKLSLQYSMTLFHAPKAKSTLHKTFSQKIARLWRPLGSPEILQTIEAKQRSTQWRNLSTALAHQRGWARSLHEGTGGPIIAISEMPRKKSRQIQL